MTKDQRAELLRARFASNHGANRWKVDPLRKSRADIQLLARVPREKTPTPCFGPIAKEGRLKKWFTRPDPEEQRALVELKRPKEEAADLTKIARKMYDFNRMPWDPRATPETCQPINLGRKTNNAAFEE